MILGYLIFAHLLGDFIFQPNRLIFWKMRSKMGVLVHVLIHFLLNLLILLPFIFNGNYWLLSAISLVCFAHFWIDQAKINYDIRHDKKTLPFIIDQLMHVFTMILVYFFGQNLPLFLPKGGFYDIYSNSYLIIFLSFAIIFSAVVEIYHFQKIREKESHATLKLNHKKMFLRVLIFTLIYAVFMAVFSSALAPAGFKPLF